MDAAKKKTRARKFQRKTAQTRKISLKTIALGVEIIATTEGN